MTEKTTGTLAQALMQAQRSLDGVAKTGRNQTQGWRFVTVEDVTRAARAALTAAGLVALYVVDEEEDPAEAVLRGHLRVLHPASGEEMRLPMPWPIERPGPQARRAAFSYARKQALVELLAIAEPDDPETSAASPSARTSRSRSSSMSSSPPSSMSSSGGTLDPAEVPNDPPPPRARSGRPPSEKQVKYLHTLLSQHGWSSRESALAYLSGELGRDITSSSDLDAHEVSQLIDGLKSASANVQRAQAGDEPPADDPWATHDPDPEEVSS